MTITAITELKARTTDAIASAEKYRDLAEQTPTQRAFYHALAVTYERAAREMQLMLDKIERGSTVVSQAA